MLKPYLLTVEFIVEFYGIEKSSAYDLIINVRKSKRKKKNYKPTVYDLCEYEEWDFNQFMFFVLATREEAVAQFGSNITSGGSTIVLDGKYSGNAVLVIPEEKIQEIIVDQFEITEEGIRPALPIIVTNEKEIVIKKVKKKKT